jgi:hypothetical protein
VAFNGWERGFSRRLSTDARAVEQLTESDRSDQKYQQTSQAEPSRLANVTFHQKSPLKKTSCEKFPEQVAYRRYGKTLHSNTKVASKRSLIDMMFIVSTSMPSTARYSLKFSSLGFEFCASRRPTGGFMNSFRRGIERIC